LDQRIELLMASAQFRQAGGVQPAIKSVPIFTIHGVLLQKKGTHHAPWGSMGPQGVAKPGIHASLILILHRRAAMSADQEYPILDDEEREPFHRVDESGRLTWTEAGLPAYRRRLARFGIRIKIIKTVEDDRTAMWLLARVLVEDPREPRVARCAGQPGRERLEAAFTGDDTAIERAWRRAETQKKLRVMAGDDAAKGVACCAKKARSTANGSSIATATKQKAMLKAFQEDAPRRMGQGGLQNEERAR
jgi:hypothetical protein